MSFEKELEKYQDFDFEKYFDNVSQQDVVNSIAKDKLNENDFLNLLSPVADNYLEIMAQKAQVLTHNHFGKKIALYVPIYLSNYCSSDCIYCGFSKRNKITRRQLTFEEIESEARALAKTKVKHVLILTGEAKTIADLNYLKTSVKILKQYFASVAVEVYPMETTEYEQLKAVGVDALTIYQETYDYDIYQKVHLSGEKQDYYYRLNTPERGCMAKIRQVNIGALYGLAKLEKEAFYSGIHANYLVQNYLDTEISISLPRIRNAEGDFLAFKELDDKTFVKFILAFRLFMPTVGINISTRELAEFRDNLIGLGVTKMSAGSKTNVGGYGSVEESAEQFEISDRRSVCEVANAIQIRGYDPVYKDWEEII